MSHVVLLVVLLTAGLWPGLSLALTGMPTQVQTDGATVGSSSQAGWGAMPDGVAARPYVSRLTMSNGGVETVLIEGGTTTPPAVSAGVPTVVITPYNLCQVGQPPSQGQCYASPNRVGVTLGLGGQDTVDQNLSGPATTATVFDMTVRLNTLGQSLRWSWANLYLLYWRATGLGTPAAQFRIRFRPVATPHLDDWTGHFGCTSTPIGTAGPCNPERASAEILAASVTLSLDDTVNTALTGAVFATQGAIFGYLDPRGTPAAPVLDLQVASTHLRSDGSAQSGVMKALLPAQALVNIYGVLPGDAASFFSTTRSGAAGTSGAPAYTTWSAVNEGTDGLLITIEGITFSAPTYVVKRKRAAARATLRNRGANVVVSVEPVAACRRTACEATLYVTPSRVSGRVVEVTAALPGDDGVFRLTFARSRLRGDASWALAIRDLRGRLVTTAAGTAAGAIPWGDHGRSAGSGR